MMDEDTWVEFAGMENGGLENDGVEQEETHILRSKLMCTTRNSRTNPNTYLTGIV